MNENVMAIISQSVSTTVMNLLRYMSQNFKTRQYIYLLL